MGSDVPLGEPVVFEGYADDYDRAITALEFSLDGGATWTRYPTKKAEAGRWVHWRFAYTPQAAGDYLLKVRSVNERDEVSPLAAVVNFSVV